MKLSDVIKDKSVKASLIEDCSKLVDEQVAAKNGVSGLALKATYKIVKGIGAGYIPGAIGRLLPEAFNALDPLWDEGLESGNPVEHLIQHQSRTADVILSVTDARAEKANGVVRSSYNKFRKSVKGDVEGAVPGLAKIIGTHFQTVQ